LEEKVNYKNFIRNNIIFLKIYMILPCVISININPLSVINGIAYSFDTTPLFMEIISVIGFVMTFLSLLISLFKFDKETVSLNVYPYIFIMLAVIGLTIFEYYFKQSNAYALLLVIDLTISYMSNWGLYFEKILSFKALFLLTFGIHIIFSFKIFKILMLKEVKIITGLECSEKFNIINNMILFFFIIITGLILFRSGYIIDYYFITMALSIYIVRILVIFVLKVKKNLIFFLLNFNKNKSLDKVNVEKENISNNRVFYYLDIFIEKINKKEITSHDIDLINSLKPYIVCNLKSYRNLKILINKLFKSSENIYSENQIIAYYKILFLLKIKNEKYIKDVVISNENEVNILNLLREIVYNEDDFLHKIFNYKNNENLEKKHIEEINDIIYFIENIYPLHTSKKYLKKILNDRKLDIDKVEKKSRVYFLYEELATIREQELNLRKKRELTKDNVKIKDINFELTKIIIKKVKIKKELAALDKALIYKFK